MPLASSLDNYLVIAGRMAGSSEIRYSPAGLPILRFVLQHQSQRLEANIPREVRCRISVMACGKALVEDAKQLSTGTLVRVRGFISRANYRQEDIRLVLHAERIEILNSSELIRG